jgi:hypothetical protein
MCFVNFAPGDKPLAATRSRSRSHLDRDKENRGKEICKKQVYRVSRPLVDALTQHVEDVSERFAHLLHMTLTLAFDDVPPSSAPLVLVSGKSTSEYVADIDYRRIVHNLLRFKCCHPQDLTSFFALVLVYLRQMKNKSALPLLEQMIVWFDVSNVIYCVAFLSHVWLLDDALPLAEWHNISEGVVKGVNLNKCVRNCLRILKYRLFVTPTQGRAALLTLEYTEKKREVLEPAVDPAALLRAKTGMGELEESLRPEPRRSRSTVRYAELARQRAASQASRARAPFAPPRRA